jgi:hypothetical protein
MHAEPTQKNINASSGVVRIAANMALPTGGYQILIWGGFGPDMVRIHWIALAVNDIVIYAVFDVRGVFAVPNKRALLDSFRMNSSWGAPRCADNNPPAICEKAVGIVGAYYGASIRCDRL